MMSGTEVSYEHINDNYCWRNCWLVGVGPKGRDEGITGSIVIGIVGAFIGGILAAVFGAGNQSFLAFTWLGLVWSFIGAIILSAILNAAQHRTHHNV